MGKKRSRGRPPKKRGKMTKQIHVHCTEAAKSRYQEAADERDEDLAKWIRDACNAAADAQLGDK